MVRVSQTKLVEGAIAGKVVSFPTDTVPALAVKPKFGKSIYRLKQRPTNKPLILMGASIEELLTYTVHTPAELSIWQKLIKQHLPGALTLVLPASDKVTSAINPTDSNTVGIRIPNHSVALDIFKQTGVLATSSANISGQETLVDGNSIDEVFPDVLVLEESGFLQNQMTSGLPSTVICWQNDTWKILRQGSVKI